jgi:hypothetical protein
LAALIDSDFGHRNDNCSSRKKKTKEDKRRKRNDVRLEEIISPRCMQLHDRLIDRFFIAPTKPKKRNGREGEGSRGGWGKARSSCSAATK